MSRKAWLVWRQGSRTPSPSLWFDDLPGPDARAYGTKILAAIELQGLDLADALAGKASLFTLAIRHPAPKEVEQ